MTRDDLIRIRHMIDAGEIAVSCVNKCLREDLANDPILRLALVKAIEIIGEAASKMSAEGKAELAGVRGPLSSACAIAWSTAT